MHTNIHDAIEECGPGHPAHVRPRIAIGPYCGRIVAIRTGNEPDTFNLTFSDSKVDLRTEGDTIYNVPRKMVSRKIVVFFDGNRTDECSNEFDQFINQAVRQCMVIRTTPTRCRIEYEMPNSGIVGAWRYQTTVGGFTYVANW